MGLPQLTYTELTNAVGNSTPGAAGSPFKMKPLDLPLTSEHPRVYESMQSSCAHSKQKIGDYGSPGGRAMRRCLCANVYALCTNVDVLCANVDVLCANVDVQCANVDVLCANVDVTFTRDGLKLHPELRPCVGRPRPYSSTRGHAHACRLQEAEKLVCSYRD